MKIARNTQHAKIEAKTRSLPDLEYFIDLAYRGQHSASSTGEQRARRLALAVLENTPCLDESAIRGFADFMQYAQSSPDSARRLIG